MSLLFAINIPLSRLETINMSSKQRGKRTIGMLWVNEMAIFT